MIEERLDALLKTCGQPLESRGIARVRIFEKGAPFWFRTVFVDLVPKGRKPGPRPKDSFFDSEPLLVPFRSTGPTRWMTD